MKEGQAGTGVRAAVTTKGSGFRFPPCISFVDQLAARNAKIETLQACSPPPDVPVGVSARETSPSRARSIEGGAGPGQLALGQRRVPVVSNMDVKVSTLFFLAT